jgi:hypothetical protein
MTHDHQDGVERWSSPAWRAEAQAWMDERLAAAGLTRHGELRQPHLRPWATALTAPTSGGDVWLKAAGPATAFEAGLYEVLHDVAPAHVLAPIALDVARGWMLLPDGGTPLAERLQGTELVDALAVALARYGELQRAVAPHTDRLLALGVRDMRAAVMAARFEEAVAGVRAYVDAHGSDADRRDLERAEAMRGQFSAWAEQVAGAPGAASLDHNDLHPWNVLVADADGGGGAGRPVVYDWGDSVVAHPFASMLVALGYVQSKLLRCAADDPRLLRVRDAYLAPFADIAPHAELVATLELACRVGKVARALTWQRVVDALEPGDIDDTWRRAPLACLASLPDDSPFGGA